MTKLKGDRVREFVPQHLTKSLWAEGKSDFKVKQQTAGPHSNAVQATSKQTLLQGLRM